ncbi:MAG: hypothetical protein IJQ34_00725 [Kiritimatiellae bacterium]|nr:hypothetical protein [Kiritimatiellia bacterium]
MSEVCDIVANGGLVIGGGAIVKAIDWLCAWWRSRQPQKIEQPVEIEKKQRFVTVGEFNKHVEDNQRDHENLFARMNRNDMVTSEINGKLTGIHDDLQLIKGKLFKTR